MAIPRTPGNRGLTIRRDAKITSSDREGGPGKIQGAENCCRSEHGAGWEFVLGDLLLPVIHSPGGCSLSSH